MDQSSASTSKAGGSNSQKPKSPRQNRLTVCKAELAKTRDTISALEQSVDAIQAENERLRALKESSSTPSATNEQDNE